MTIRPFLPRTFIASAAAEGWNRLAAFAGQPLPFGGRGASAVFEEAPAPSPDLPRAGFEIDGARVQVVIAAFPFAALFGTELQASDLPALPRPLADALVDGIANLVRAALPDGAPPFARSVYTDDPLPEDGTTWFALVLDRIAPEPIGLLLGASRETFAALAERWLPGPADARGGASPIAGFDATLLRAALPAADLARIPPGSLLVLPAGLEDRPALRLGASAFQFHRTAEGLRFAGAAPAAAVPIGSPHPEDTAVTHDAETEPTPLAAIPLPVDFDIGRVELPLGDIARWRPGVLVPLDLPALADGLTVTIRINGATVGTGELVLLEDRYAVRIQHVAAP